MSTPPRQPSEEEIRAAYEAEVKKLRVDDVLVQTVVSLVNLAGRKAGLAPGSEEERDPAQLKKAIDATMALLPLVEGELGQEDAGQIRNAVSQLQMAYAQLATGAGGPASQAEAPQGEKPAGEPSGDEQGPGPAQSSGRLWVPGQ